MLAGFGATTPSTPAPTPVTGTFDVLVRVKVRIGSMEHRVIWRKPVPGQLRPWAIVHVVGMRLKLTTEVKPVPLRPTGEPLTATPVAAMVAVPAGAGPIAVGENTTLIEQLVPAARVVRQLGAPAGKVPVLVREKGAVIVTVIPVRVEPPVLCRVSICPTLVVLTAILPNANGPPVTMAAAAPGWNSTAPASTKPFFLALLKKSRFGASV